MATYDNWLAELQALFPVRDEFLLAGAIYPFMDDFEHGLSPKQSYAAFDAFAACEDA